MTGFQIVAFDCDGVLFDTSLANRSYYNHILSHFGRPEMTEEEFRFVHMHTVDESTEFLFGDEDSLEAVQSFRKKMTYDRFIREMEIEPYLKTLLKKIRPDFRTAIATNRTDTMDRVLLEFDLEQSFDLVVCAHDVPNPKPHPDQLFKVMNHFGAKPEQILYIGDSEVDEKAANAAGVPLAAYKNRHLDADFHIDSLKEVERILGINGTN